jgi:hypothetical protein
MKSKQTGIASWPVVTLSAFDCSRETATTGLTAIPAVTTAVHHLKVRSCLIDGEAVACDERGLAVFELLRNRPSGRPRVPLRPRPAGARWTDLRREPLETRKATLVRRKHSNVRSGEAPQETISTLI